MRGLARMRDGVFLNVDGGPPDDPEIGVVPVFEDSHGAQWLGSGRGLKRIQNGQRPFVALPAGYSADAIAEDRRGDLWIGSVGGGQGGLFRLARGVLAQVSGAERLRARCAPCSSTSRATS